MDLQGLKIFIEVAELRSFTRAGAKLGYSQPTVSFQIKQLEKELGAKLFDRIGHTVRLTDAGRDALDYAQQICRLSDEMAAGAGARGEIKGIVKLGMADSLCEPLIVSHFSSFREKHPNVSLQIHTGGTGELFRLLDHNEVDMVCTFDWHIYDTNYIIAAERNVGVHFVISAKNELASHSNITIEDLLAQPFILTEKGMSYRRLLDEKLAQDSLEIHPILEMGSADLICRLVAEDMGVSFLPDYVTEEAVKAGLVVRLPLEEFHTDVWMQLLYRRDKWVSSQMHAMIDHLKESMQ